MQQASDSFDAAYPALFRHAYRAAFRLLGDRSDAEEVAQEALTRALVRWRRIESYAEPWVVRVATNLAIDMTRRRTRLTTEEVDRQVTDTHAEERIDLIRALAALPKRQREVVVLRYLGDFSEAAVASALGLGSGTVKSHASRGLAALRSALGPLAERG
jgi:RNA polymerase sigma-70 factor (sigma-E family)